MTLSTVVETASGTVVVTEATFVVYAGTVGCLPDYTSEEFETVSEALAELDWYTNSDDDDTGEWSHDESGLSASRGIQIVWIEVN